MAQLSNRLQLLLDDDRRDRLERESSRTGAPISVLVRRAIDRMYPPDGSKLETAVDRFLALEPMPVEDWPQMKQAMRDELSDPAV
jgi:hypothetical protein